MKNVVFVRCLWAVRRLIRSAKTRSRSQVGENRIRCLNVDKMENSQINSQSGSVSQEVRDLKKICIVLAAVAAIALSTVFAAVYVICHLQAEDPGSDGAVTWNDSAATSAGSCSSGCVSVHFIA